MAAIFAQNTALGLGLGLALGGVAGGGGGGEADGQLDLSVAGLSGFNLSFWMI